MLEIEIWHWLAFSGLVVALLALDLFVFHRTDHAPSIRESVFFTVFWIVVSLVFNAFVWWWQGTDAGLQFLNGYLVEKSLSMDNVFVFAVIFRYFQVPVKFQYRVLFWGIMAAVFLRLVFILAGSALIHKFDWVLPLFGAFLVYTAVKLVRHSGAEVDPEHNIVRRIARRFLPIATEGQHQYGHAFFIRQHGRLYVTPMFLVLLVIESTDIVFAVDSVPAILGISREPFIVFTSNVFAILGLRALYFLLAGAIEMFRYLHYGLAAVLGFIGLKMIGEWAVPDVHVPQWVSLAVIAALLTISIAASLVANRWAERQQHSP